jgi:hypothetical protein
MTYLLRWFPIWLLSLICIAIGILNGISIAQGAPPQCRADAWERFYAQIDWYALALVVYWAQLLVWAFAWRADYRIWYRALGAAFFASGLAFLLAVWACFRVDELFH